MNTNTRKNIMIVAIFTVVSKIIAIIRQMVLTYFFGASSITDAYILSQSIPNTLFLLISTAIAVSYIPVFNKAKKEKGKSEAELFTSRVINAVLIISSFIVLITLFFSKSIILLFASGFDQPTVLLAASYLRISIFSIYFIGMCGVLSSYLKIKGEYLAPSIIGIALSVVEIVSCVIAYFFGDVMLAVGVTIAAFAQFLIVLFFSLKYGYRHKITFSFRDKYFKQAILMAFPVMVGLGIDEINVIVDRNIASSFPAGSISALNYSNTIVTIIHNIISVSMYTVLFTDVSKLASENNKEEVAKRIQNSLSGALLFLIPATIGLILFSEPIVEILYERGSFTHESTLITSSAMIFYSLYVIPNGVRLLVQSYFYAYGKTKTCMYVGILGVITNIVLNIILSQIMGINGLALSTSLGILLAAIVLFVLLIKSNIGVSVKILSKQFFVVFVNSSVMGIMSYGLYIVLMEKINILFALLISVTFGLVIYLIMSIFTRTFNTKILSTILKRRG